MDNPEPPQRTGLVEAFRRGAMHERLIIASWVRCEYPELESVGVADAIENEDYRRLKLVELDQPEGPSRETIVDVSTGCSKPLKVKGEFSYRLPFAFPVLEIFDDPADCIDHVAIRLFSPTVVGDQTLVCDQVEYTDGGAVLVFKPGTPRPGIYVFAVIETADHGG